MNFWKLLSRLWERNGSTGDRFGAPRQAPTLDSLNEVDELEDRNVQGATCPGNDELRRVSPAEVLRVSFRQRARHTYSTQSRIIRLSVAVVDYLLEREWYWLATGRHKPRPGHRSERRAPREKFEAGLPVDSADPTDESNRTLCMTDSSWSIMATIEHSAPDDPRLTRPR